MPPLGPHDKFPRNDPHVDEPPDERPHDKLKLGPTGKFYRGGPAMPGDRGGLYASFHIDKPSRQAAINFGTVLGYVWLPPEQSIAMAKYMRFEITAAFGQIPYDASTLPITVKSHKEKRLVESRFPVEVSVLVANPEVFLAWADRLEQEAEKIIAI
jgi:hypothetical protein